MRLIFVLAALSAALSLSTSTAKARTLPKHCKTAEAPLLCKIHKNLNTANLLRQRMNLHRIRYHWTAERYPARRPRLAHYWHGVRVHTQHRYHHYLRSPWPAGWLSAALCVHHYEGAWNANTGNGYYGGFQADLSFQQTYNAAAYSHWGTANNWSPHEQLVMAYRGWLARGWEPWPTTSAMCGL